MPALPSSLLTPIWVQFAALLPARPEYDPAHPLGCHRRRIPDRVVFEHVINALVHGSGYERIATAGCSDRTIRRRRKAWADAGLSQQLHALALAAHDHMIGLDLHDLAVDGALTKAPCGGQRAGRSPVDRGKGGLKRSTTVDATGIPLAVISAPANRNDNALLEASLDTAVTQTGPIPEHVTVHLDRAYDNTPTRQRLTDRGLHGQIARKGVPAPIQVGRRWVVERTNSWMNDYGKIRRCTERDAAVVDFYLYLAAALITTRQLIRRARPHYRWDGRPTTRRLK
ncbi:IS5 family transposase [Catellatospora bangladeshensis]|uniref:Transposase n=1 Tax=Catellatospora bangladeshensis TaxID=310355 RepID=A0A8J3NQ18_9ACTN|nr:IS5 family transposase [Catellatospora bangladeshensis]GIF86555.1 transposase [Catellatospora bangladeshensis]